MKIIPVNNKVIIKKIKKEEKKGALILLSKNDEYEPFFEIVSICIDCTLELKVGDHVYIDRYSNHAIEGNNDLFIVREDNIIGII